MNIHLYSILWNEEPMLPFFFRHYDPIVDRYVLYDDGSRDRTLEILAGHPKVEVRRVKRSHPTSYVLSAQTLHDTMWKESRGRADWAIVTAVDEHLHHPDGLRAYLERAKRSGITAVPALGFQMVTDEFPTINEHLAETRRMGVRLDNYNKLSVFDPGAVEELNCKPGRHRATPRGRLIAPKEDTLLLLHYKFLGLDYVVRRYAELSSGLGTTDREKKYGFHWDAGCDALKAEFEELRRNAFDVTSAEAQNLKRRKWWRKDG